jgi:hypothetical protein
MSSGDLNVIMVGVSFVADMKNPADPGGRAGTMWSLGGVAVKV